MTKEDELKKQAETEYRKQEERCEHSWNGAVFQFGYLAGAEPREKRITDLEIQIEKMREKHKQDELGLIISNSSARAELEKENAELKARLQKKINTTTVSDYPYSALKLEEAKEIIALGLRVCETSSIEYINWYQKRAEQFINDLEK